MSIVALVAIGAVAAYVAARTLFGRQSMRSEETNAPRRSRACSPEVCSAFTGLVVASELVAADPAASGDTFELKCDRGSRARRVVACGRTAGVRATIVAAFVIGVLSDGLAMFGVCSFLRTVIKGTVVIAAVLLDQLQRQMQRRMALQAQFTD